MNMKAIGLMAAMSVGAGVFAVGSAQAVAGACDGRSGYLNVHDRERDQCAYVANSNLNWTHLGAYGNWNDIADHFYNNKPRFTAYLYANVCGGRDEGLLLELAPGKSWVVAGPKSGVSCNRLLTP